MNKSILKPSLILSLLMVSLLSGLTISTLAQGEDPKAPNWALDPQKHSNLIGEYDLHGEYALSYSDPYSKETVDAWFQIWFSPKGCVQSTTSCDAVLGTVYIETSTQISQKDVDKFKETVDKIYRIEDITAKVPGAALSIIYYLSIPGYSIYFGFTIYQTMRHYMFVTEASITVTKNLDISAHDTLGP